MNRMTAAVLATFVVILLGSGILSYVFRDQPGTAVTPTPSTSPGSQVPAPAASEKQA